MQKIKKHHNLRRYGNKYILWNHLLDLFARTAIRIFALLTINAMRLHTIAVVVMNVVGRKINFVQDNRIGLKVGIRKNPHVIYVGLEVLTLHKSLFFTSMVI
jgi:hypothetical protein